MAVWVGNFNGRPMEGVSGVTGAGPLLHRAVLATAARHRPGRAADARGGRRGAGHDLPPLRPPGHGALPAAVEWFVPGTAPDHACDWHAEGGIRLPPEYAEWAQQNGAVPAEPARLADSRPAPDSTFRLLSPRDGDVYRVPPGVDGRYATVPLRAAGARGAVRWFVDGRPYEGARWPLDRGSHEIRAADASGTFAGARVTVE